MSQPLTVREYQRAFIKHAEGVKEKLAALKPLLPEEVRAPTSGGIAMLATMIDSVRWQLEQPEETVVFGLPANESEDQFPPAS